MSDEKTSAPAETPDAQPVLPDFSGDYSYDVKLKRSVEWPAGSGFYFRPTDHQIINGAVCKEVADAIYSAVQVE